MSTFSQMLNSLVREQKVNITDMARYCAYDRPTLHKILNGERTPPSAELVQKFCRYLNLSLADSEQLTEAYFAALFGEETYDEFSAVKNFVLNYSSSAIPPITSSVSVSPVASKDEPALTTALSSFPEVQDALCSLVFKTSECADNTLTVIAQPECGAVCHHLEQAANGLSVGITHLLCLDNHQDDGASARYNIACLQEVLKLFSTLPAYKVLYYYDDASARFSGYALHPCLFVSDAGALITNASLTKGIFHQSPDAIHLYSQYASAFSEHCDTLFRISTDVMDQISVYSQFDGPIRVLESLPCFMNSKCLSPELIEAVLLPEIPERQAVVGMINHYLEQRSSHFFEDKSCSYFTENGLLYFAKTGRFPEIPDAFYRALDPQERIQVLKSMLPFIKNHSYQLLHKINFSMDLSICLQGNDLVLTFKSRANQYNIVLLNEPRLTGMFSRFFDHLEAYHYLLSEEQTLQVLLDAIHLLEKEERNQ